MIIFSLNLAKKSKLKATDFLHDLIQTGGASRAKLRPRRPIKAKIFKSGFPSTTLQGTKEPYKALNGHIRPLRAL